VTIEVDKGVDKNSIIFCKFIYCNLYILLKNSHIQHTDQQCRLKLKVSIDFYFNIIKEIS